MKFKTWLLMSFLILIIVPLIALYSLYITADTYYQHKIVNKYLQDWNLPIYQKELLANPDLYTTSADYSAIEDATTDQLMITLYSANGSVLYISNPLNNFEKFERRDRLYKNLFELQQAYNTIIYKEPVYKDNLIVGIYKISLARAEWGNYQPSKMLWVIGGLIVVLVMLYCSILYFLNRRFNQPMKRLIQQVQDFDKYLPIENYPMGQDEIGDIKKFPDNTKGHTEHTTTIGFRTTTKAIYDC